jgi:hypothetical protein
MNYLNNSDKHIEEMPIQPPSDSPSFPVNRIVSDLGITKGIGGPHVLSVKDLTFYLEGS